jgi:cell division protein FtsL
MAPPPAAPAAARRATAAPQPRPSTRRPPLRVFEPEPRRSSRRGLSRRGHVWVGVALVVASLLAVVVADAMVAQGQVRLASIQSKIDGQLAIQKTAQSDVAQLAAPARIVGQAIVQGSVAPAQVVDLPQVPLNVPLPVPDTSPLPVVAKPATTPAAGTTATATHSTPTTASPAKPAIASTPTTVPVAR